MPSKNLPRRKAGYFFLSFLLFIILAGSCGKEGGKSKIYHIGILWCVDFFAETKDGFQSRMAELGYVNNENIFYDIRKSDMNPANEEVILKEFEANDVDLIFTFPTEVSLMAKTVAKGTGIPVLFANAHLEGVDLVNSIREPGTNITGIRYPGPDLAIKRLETMIEFLPGLKTICVPYHKNYPIVAVQLEVLRPLAKTLGIRMIEIPATSPEDLRQTLASQKDAGIDAILQIVEPLGVTPATFVVLAEFAAGQKIPVGGAIMSVDGHNSLFGISTKNIPTGEQAAQMADMILKGTPAGEIPVVSAESYFSINIKAARALNLEVSESLLSRAYEIIR